MPRTMKECHALGQHEKYPRSRCPDCADAKSTKMKVDDEVVTCAPYGFDCGDGWRLHSAGKRGRVVSVSTRHDTVLASGPRGRAHFIEIMFDSAQRTVEMRPYQVAPAPNEEKPA